MSHTLGVSSYSNSAAVLSHAQVKHSMSHRRLTAREQDVLALLACGLQNKEIAKVLAISPNTVAGYIKDIYRKLSVNNRAAATFAAIDMGLLTEPRPATEKLLA